MNRSQPNPFDMDTGAFFRLYKDADQMTRDNLVLGLHMKLQDQKDELRKTRVLRDLGFIWAAIMICLIAASAFVP
jgi:hypothetical protein